MVYEVILTNEINFAPATETEEILQNIRMILATRIGTVAGHRDFGLTWEHIDKPFHIAKSLLIAEITDAIDTYEPRAKVEEVNFDENVQEAMDGIMRPRVFVSIGDDEEGY